MAKTITQLPDATSVADSDELIVQQSGITKRASKLEVLAGIKNASIASDAAIAASKLAAALDLSSKTVTLPDASVSLAKLSAPQYTGFRNRIINGNFDIWQRGTSHSSNGYGSVDRWVNAIVGSSSTMSRQAFTLGQTDVPNEPVYFCRMTVTSSAGTGNRVIFGQFIEDARTFAGQTVTVSFYAKADASKSIALELAQDFGTGGSPSASVSAIGSQKLSLTTSWQKFTATISVPSLSGKTFGSDNNSYFGALFWLDAGSDFNSRTDTLGQQSGTFDIAQVQVEQGSVATPFEARPIGTEQALCERYYVNGKGLFTGGGGVVGLPVTMRVAPTAATGVIDAGTGGTWGALSRQQLFEVTSNSTGSGAAFSASAEL